MNKIKKKFILILVILVTFLGCRNNKMKRYEESRFLFGTFIKIIVYHTNSKVANEAINSAFQEIERVDNEYNSKNPKSPIYRFNNLEDLNNVEKIYLDSEGVDIFRKVKKYYELTDGKYDITIGPLMKIWGFYDDTEIAIEPSKDEIETAKSKIGFENIEITSDALMVSKPVVDIDTGSFLKGYALDRGKKVLEKMGIQHGFITSISTIVTIGTRGDGVPWRVGVENPLDNSKQLGVIELSGESLSISGDYQTYVEVNGKKYHHILNKETGYPIDDKKMVIIIGNTGLETDILSTGIFLVQKDKISKILEERRELQVIIIDNNMDKIRFNTSILNDK